MKKLLAPLCALLLLTGCVTPSPAAAPVIISPTPSAAEPAPDGESPQPAEKELYIMDESLQKLRNPNASAEAQLLFNYLCSIDKQKTLTGQQESTWMGTVEYEMLYIEEKTGKLPAMRGLDYINDDFDGVNERAVKWWEKGGIVSICWHWGAPPDGVGYESSKDTIDLDEALTEGTELYDGMLKQMDRAAEALRVLQEAGVPVLWRPFHEFEGAWFWWGKGGNENFIKLWRLMYDRYTNEFGLNNLIWVLGFTDKVRPTWYPGDDYVDIIGGDSYEGGTQESMYKKLTKIGSGGGPIAYHECGPIPDLDKCFKDGVYWSWFLTWHTIHIKDQNTAEHLNKVYNSDFAVTLDKLPRWK